MKEWNKYTQNTLLHFATKKSALNATTNRVLPDKCAWEVCVCVFLSVCACVCVRMLKISAEWAGNSIYTAIITEKRDSGNRPYRMTETQNGSLIRKYSVPLRLLHKMIHYFGIASLFDSIWDARVLPHTANEYIYTNTIQAQQSCCEGARSLSFSMYCNSNTYIQHRRWQIPRVKNVSHKCCVWVEFCVLWSLLMRYSQGNRTVSFYPFDLHMHCAHDIVCVWATFLTLIIQCSGSGSWYASEICLICCDSFFCA